MSSATYIDPVTGVTKLYNVSTPIYNPFSNPTATTSTTTFVNPNWSAANNPNLSVSGSAVFHGTVEVRGRDILEVLEGIEHRLAILRPNKKLEEKWDRLRALGDMYRELEQEIIEKEQIWASLKK